VGGKAHLVAVGEEGLLVLVLDDLEGVKAQIAADVILLHAGDGGLVNREGKEGEREGEMVIGVSWEERGKAYTEENNN